MCAPVGHLGLKMGTWYLAKDTWPLLSGQCYANKRDTSLAGCAIRNFCSHSVSLLFGAVRTKICSFR